MDDQQSQRTVEQRVLDGLLPEEMDWEQVVRTYPLTSITVAGIAGFLVGSRSGRGFLPANVRFEMSAPMPSHRTARSP